MIADAREVPREIAGRGKALLRILRQASLDDPSQRRRHLGAHFPDRFGLLPDDRRHRLGRRLALKRLPARRDLVEDRSERELIRPEVERLPARLLG